jgi:hypothetical protein
MKLLSDSWEHCWFHKDGAIYFGYNMMINIISVKKWSPIYYYAFVSSIQFFLDCSYIDIIRKA